MSLRLSFNYVVKENEIQKRIYITPSDETAAQLPGDFMIDATYSKTYDDKAILTFLASGIAGELADMNVEHDDTADFVRMDGHVEPISLKP